MKHLGSKILKGTVILASCLTFGVLLFLIAYILIKGLPNLSPKLFSLHYTTENVSMLPAIINTIEMTLCSLIVAVPLGICTAIYLVEYAKKGNKVVGIIRLTAETLSGIPSIVYGLFGMLFFVTYLKWGYSILAGAATLAIMVLPLIMRTTEEALLAVSDSYREASFGVGAGKLRTVFKIVLPAAMPGILSGVILAIGRIVGETAALIYTAGTVAEVSKGLLSSGRTLAIHMYVLSSEGLYTNQAYATAVVLLIFVLIINFMSSLVAKKIDMQIPENKVTAFIGPSGCGKSTFLKTLNRMNDLVEGCKIDGTVLLDGKNVYGDIEVNELRRRVGMVFQKPNPFPMSIYDNIAYGPRTHGIKAKSKLDEIVERSLKQAAIWDETKDRLKKSALGMSGGQQQRLCIARALAVEPEVIMVTHNMQQAARVSDKTAFFLLGEAVEFDDTQKIFSKPKDKRTEDYITGRFG